MTSYHSLFLTKDKIKEEEDNSHDDTTGGEDTKYHCHCNVHCHCLISWYSIATCRQTRERTLMCQRVH